MATLRFRSRHAKRAFAGALAACVAATAMAFSSGGWRHTNDDEAPDPSHLRQDHGGQAGGGGVAADTQDNGQGPGGFDLAQGGPPAGDADLMGGPPGPPGGGAFGPGDNNDSDGPGFMPNGEDGLMTLASFAQNGGAGGDGGKDGVSGGEAPGDGGGMGFGGPPGDGGLPGDGTQVASSSSGGFGLLGGGGGDGGGFPGGAGGGGSGIGGGTPPVTTPGGSPDGACPTSPLACAFPPGNPGDPGLPGGRVDPPEGGPVGGPESGFGGGPGDPTTFFGPVDGGPTGDGPTDFGPPGGGGPTGGGDPPKDPITQTGGDHGVGGGVPEPAVWLTMIMGFAGLGQALRARRRAV
jgi:hypothetical protein